LRGRERCQRRPCRPSGRPSGSWGARPKAYWAYFERRATRAGATGTLLSVVENRLSRVQGTA
jgi:hypothetical protein